MFDIMYEHRCYERPAREQVVNAYLRIICRKQGIEIITFVTISCFQSSIGVKFYKVFKNILIPSSVSKIIKV